MKGSRLLLSGILALAIITAGVVLAIASRRGPPIQVSYGQVTAGPIVREVMTTGTLEPAKAVDTGTQVSGTVQSLHADFNDRVRAGQIIARLDPSVYDSELSQARSRLIQAEADAQRAAIFAADADVKRARAEELVAQDLITQAEADTARLTAKQVAAEETAADAAVRLARAALTEAQVTRDRTIIRSPIDGVIVNRSVEIGQTLAAAFNSPVLFTIADLRHMQLLAEINEADVGGVRPGTSVTFAVESLSGERFKGTVADVRLQPVGQQAAAGAATTQPSTSSGTAAAATPAGTTGNTPSSGTQSATTAGAVATSGSAQSTATAPATQGTTPTPPAGSIVAYTAIIEVDNQAGRLTPGSTAVLTIPAAQRPNVVRVPNRALAFRPSPDVFDALGEQAPSIQSTDPPDKSANGRQAHVWKYEGGRFVAIPVRVGLADETWTELLSGPLQPGEALVTDAQRPSR
jgi:RND family efflux transporter MFP subunit